MNAFTSLGLLLSLTACATIYLASPNQRWRSRPLATKAARPLAGLLLVLGWLALWQAMQAITASFVFLTWLMLIFSLLPYLGSLRKPPEGR